MRRPHNWGVLALLSAGVLALTCLVTPNAIARTYYVPVTGTLVLHGHGYGHGHGMSQYGAQGAALAGRSYREILRFYYPHTALERQDGHIRVLLTADTSSDVTVLPTRGLLVRDGADRSAWRLPTDPRIDMWRLTPTPANATRTSVQLHNGSGWHRWKVPHRKTFAGAAQFEAGAAIRLVLPGGSTPSYRGALRSAVPYPGAKVRDTVNVLDLDAYVRGVIAREMPASWAPAALRSQAVAARTYASYLQRANAGRYYQICDTTACQVYGGVSAETASTNSAVKATAGRILMFDGRPALTQFSASSGGWTSAGDKPYLPAKKDRYDRWDGNSVHSWVERISTASLESRYPELGRLQAVRVTSRDGNGQWGGRIRQLVLEGSRSTVALSGDDLRSAYGLRSSWFTFEPTPIIAAWRHLGGAKSAIGRPTSPEEPVTGHDGRQGAKQVFAHGRMFWSRETGAHALTGPILRRYGHAGGPRSRYGFPVTGVMRAAGKGSKVRFDTGMFFRSRATGPRPVYGRILAAYGRRHYSAGPLGFPVTAVSPTAGGLRSRFQHGTIRWDRRTGKVAVSVHR